MGKKAKAKGKEKRKAAKRAVKAAKKKQYQKFAELGKNKKSKRFRARKKKTARKVDHPNGPCGNPGCEKCHSIKFKNFLRDGKPHRMRQKMWLKWKELNS
jgi:hypothetical protein